MNHTANTSAAFVADELPATAPTPAPTQRISCFRAVLLHWLVPKRYGPHLAQERFRRAFATHVASVVVAGAILLAPSIVASLPRMGASSTFRGLRVLAAEFVLDAAATSAFARVPTATAIMVVGAIPLSELAILLAATAAMPWCAGGDRASSVWKRSVKNAYWSTTILIPAALVVTLGRAVSPDRYGNDALAILLALTVIVVPPVLVVRMLLTGASRYVGPPDGPAFAPREPRCDDCGYTLIRLPIDGNCPECGLPIHESLPGGRRQPTVWQQGELRPRGFLELIRLQWVILWRPEFFKRLPVHSGLPAARHFWWGTYLLMGVVILTLLRVLYALADPEAGWREGLGGVALLAMFVPFALQSAAMFAACLWGQVRHGIRDYRVSAVVCYYGAPLMWPLLVTLAAAGIAGSWLATIVDDAEASRLQLWVGGAILAGLLGLAVGWLSFWLRRLSTAMAAVRWSNV